MGVQQVHRPARATRPLPAPGDRTIEAPPNLPEGKPASPVTTLLPMAGVLSSVIMMTVIRSSQFAAIGAVVLVVAVVGGVAMLFTQRGRAQRTRRTQRERYLEYLEEIREELSAEDHRHRETARRLAPAPNALHDLVNDPARLWERRRSDRDFLVVRAGAGEVPVRNLRLEEKGSNVLTPPDRFMLNEAAGLRERFSTAPDMPLTVPLDRVGNVTVIGAHADAVRLVRTLVAQAAVSHAPDDVSFGVACPDDRLPEWEWMKWLPHVLNREGWDGPVHARRMASGLRELSRTLATELRERASYAAELRRGLAGREALQLSKRLLVVSDAHGEPAEDLRLPDESVRASDVGLTVIHLLERQIDEPDRVSVRITLGGPDGRDLTVEDLRTAEPVTVEGTLDEVTAAGAVGLARMLAPLRLTPESAASGAPLSGAVDFAAQLGVEDPAALPLNRLWASRRGDQAFLRVPIGLGDNHEPVLLDLKQSAELGMGPHGLCVGATGSGKSELLRTLVLALVATHPPEDLAMVLVDYKGGATFAPFAELPHVAGVITNLENSAGLVERVHASLAGEVKRRQQQLKDAGDIADIQSYAVARAERPELAPMPHLFVVIDEFGELLTAKPDFIDLFLSIGRIGRSIGVHLLLSSQRIEGGKLRGLETYLSYRLGLRTFSPEESRTVLDTPDAFHLPPIPGFGYLKVDTSSYERFKASYVSGPYQGPVRRDDEEEEKPTALPYPAFNTLAERTDERDSSEESAAPAPKRSGPTLMGTVIGQLTQAADPVQQIWLPPLPEALPLDAVAGPLRAGKRGLQFSKRPAVRPSEQGGASLRKSGAGRGAGSGGAGRAAQAMRVPLGLLDDPARQWQGQWVLDLTLAGGHAAVIGGPQSGKTTLLRSIALSLALSHTPREVGVYGLDLVGGGLQSLAGLPHVGGVAGRADRERASRTVEEVRSMLVRRERVFREHGIDSVDHLRRVRAAGELPELGSTDIVLLVDGFGGLREDFESLDDSVGELLKRGGGYGIHVVASMLRWSEVRMAAQSTFGTRLELRLNDPGESTVDRKLSKTLSPNEPGRVLTDGKLFAHAALPRTDSAATDEDLGAATERAVRAVRSAWSGEPAPPVRVLPTRLPARRLPRPSAEPHRVPIGLRQNDMSPVMLDLFGRDQHLLVLGDSECGKTNLLRLVAEGLMARYTEDELVFAVYDPRRNLHSAVPEAYRGGYAHNAKLAAALSGGIAGELEKRMPDDDLPPEQLAAGLGEISGPRIVILVDDYDILTSARQQPLEPFVPYLPSAQDIGLHFVMTRRVAGASRALYEPLLTGLRESGASALIMNGERAEGQLFPRVYAGAQPPGRGTFVRRGRPARLMQTAVIQDEAEDE